MTSHPHDPSAWQRPSSASLVDPEDDLPSATYGGDFETTTIPHYSANIPTPARRGLGLLSEPEPLPYVQPGPAGRHAAPAPEVANDEHIDDRVRAAGRRGTQDLGLLLLRTGVGVILVAHGLQKAFGWWGGQGLSGFRNSLSDLGYQHADVLTYLAAGTQIAAGVLLVLGLLTPLAAAAALAYLLNGVLADIAARHATGGYFAYFLPNDSAFQVLMIVALAAVILAGPGRYGFDAQRGWARRPFIGSFAALLLGIGAGVAAWVLLNGHTLT